MQAQYYTEGTRTIIACASLSRNFLETLYAKEISTDSHLSLPGALPGRGRINILEFANTTCVLRHYFRGGWCRKWCKDSYFYTGLRNTRPWREWHLLLHMYQQQLPVPRPIASIIERRGLIYKGDLITEMIPHTTPLSLLIQHQNLSDSLWKNIGRTIKQFHHAGIYHADLNAHNILIDQENKVWIIDFDRCYRRKKSKAWQHKNLLRLKRSLLKLQLMYKKNLPIAHWELLMGAYEFFEK